MTDGRMLTDRDPDIEAVSMLQLSEAGRADLQEVVDAPSHNVIVQRFADHNAWKLWVEDAAPVEVVEDLADEMQRGRPWLDVDVPGVEQIAADGAGASVSAHSVDVAGREVERGTLATAVAGVVGTIVGLLS